MSRPRKKKAHQTVQIIDNHVDLTKYKVEQKSFPLWRGEFLLYTCVINLEEIILRHETKYGEIKGKIYFDSTSSKVGILMTKEEREKDKNCE